MSFKSGFVTVIGRPNVGKSTLLNRIIGEKIAIISDKPQTTRNVIRMIMTDEQYQIIFIDTPGIHKPRNKLGEYMVDIAQNSMNQTDVIIMMTDELTGAPGPGDEYILKQLEKTQTPVILVINKTDTVPKSNILKVIQEYSTKFDFVAVVPISAQNGDGVNELINEIKKLLPEGPMYFPEDEITDQPERQIVAEYIREKILRMLQDEIPHGTGVEILSFEKREGKELIDIQADIYCERDSHKRIIIGSKGSMLKRIGSEARQDLEGLLGTKINLQLWVKVRENWRDNISVLNTLGYKRE